MKSYQKNRDVYQNGDCIHKRSSRFILQGLIGEFFDGYPIKFLTLPAESFALEEWIQTTHGCTEATFVEVNKDVYDRQKQWLKNSSVYVDDENHIWGNVFEVKANHRLDFVWLDLCSVFTEDTYYGILEFLKLNKFRRNAILAFTFATCREKEKHQLFYRNLARNYELKYDNLQQFRNTLLPKILQMTIADYFYPARLEAKYQYSPSSNPTGGGSMAMYAFSLNR